MMADFFPSPSFYMGLISNIENAIECDIDQPEHQTLNVCLIGIS
jgi:hypothetical protein